MARRWTPQRFVTLRRIRVAACAAAVVIASTATFALTSRKSIALDVNGETTTVVTYAMTVDRLLKDQGIDVKTHDQVIASSGAQLRDRDVITVRSAYQTTITIDGQEVPFWTVATSAEQLLEFFEANEHEAARITVDIGNVYNQLTGGLVINADGPVTVIADGASSVAPDGNLPAASILDAKGIVLNKEDRVSVEKNGDETILRVRRVTHGEQTRTESVPFSTQTVIDPALDPGQTVIRQEGVNGEIRRVYDVTYVDGEPESETLLSETTVTIAIDRIVAVGPETMQSPDDTSNGQADSGSNPQAQPDNEQATAPDDDATDDDAETDDGNGDGAGDASQPSDNGTAESPESDGDTQATPPDSGTDNSGNTGNTGTGNTDNGSTGGNTGNSNTGNGTGDGGATQGRLWHPTVAQAQTYAAGAAAQYGWTGAEWDALIWLWNHESGWLWYADNPWSDAYGIPQALPGSKMGPGWQDDGAVQIDWGLSYIAQCYGSPTQAVAFWQQHNWY